MWCSLAGIPDGISGDLAANSSSHHLHCSATSPSSSRLCSATVMPSSMSMQRCRPTGRSSWPLSRKFRPRCLRYEYACESLRNDRQVVLGGTPPDLQNVRRCCIAGNNL